MLPLLVPVAAAGSETGGGGNEGGSCEEAWPSPETLLLWSLRAPAAGYAPRQCSPVAAGFGGGGWVADGGAVGGSTAADAAGLNPPAPPWPLPRPMLLERERAAAGCKRCDEAADLEAEEDLEDERPGTTGGPSCERIALTAAASIMWMRFTSKLPVPIDDRRSTGAFCDVVRWTPTTDGQDVRR